MLARVTHILPITSIRRERLSPLPGKVLVRQGQMVNATDVVVEANLHPAHRLLNVSRALAVSPKVADRCIVVREGEQIAKGDVIAGPVGLARRVLRAPRDGRVVLAGDGQILLDVTEQLFQLRSGLPGEVVQLVADRGVVIETTGVLIQGVWGNGRINFGLMTIIARQPDHVATRDQLDVSLRGSVLLAGHCNDIEVLKSAEELPLRGLILSSISPDLISAAQEIRVPVIVLEGFGVRPFNKLAFRLLTTNDSREVAINAQAWDRFKGDRPELVIYLPSTGALALPRDAQTYKKDQQVRILRAPHAGEVGQVVRLIDAMVFPSGLRLSAAEVRLEEGDKIMVPLANLEVLA